MCHNCIESLDQWFTFVIYGSVVFSWIPTPTTFFGSCSRFSIVPLYTLLMTTALSPPLPTLCDNDLYLRKSNDPINKNIYFLDRIIIITVEYSRVLDWLFLWLDIHSCRIWLKKKQDFCGFFFFPAVFRTANRTFNGPPIILSQVTTRKFQLWLNRTLRVESGRELSES